MLTSKPNDRARQLEAFLESLEGDVEFGPQVFHLEKILPQEARYGRLDPSLPQALAKAVAAGGLERLFTHQVEAIEAVRAGKDVIIATPTASGKSHIYWLSILERLFSQPEARSLFLYPLKALEQDQLKGLSELTARLAACGGPKVGAAIYDGDTPPGQRQKIRKRPPATIITNPDMLHRAILAYHDKWARFFSRLSYVVLDEAHTYRGIFGSHIVQIIRRLKRVCELYGSRPQFILSTATIDNPAAFGQTLIGRPIEAIVESGAPKTGRYFLFLNPDLSASNTAARLLVRAVAAGLKTIVFTQSRKMTELIHMWASKMAPEARISSYRAGFLPEERRRIEADMASGRLDAVVSTSALELGIDIGSLDLCLLVGYPGTVVTTWQRAGRVGRSDRTSGVVLIAQPDALDQHFVRNPDDFFRRGFEPAVVDPDNLEVVGPHLVCTAAEIPLPADDQLFGLEAKKELLSELESQRLLLLTADSRLYLARRSRPQANLDIRSVGVSYAIMTPDRGRAIGAIDGIRAFKECHPQAIYLHMGEQYLVDELDLDRRNILAHPAEVDYYTRVQSEKETEILKRLDSRQLDWFRVNLGRLKVTEQITGFEKRRIRGQELLSSHSLDLPPQVFETVGLWIEIDQGIKDLVLAEKGHFMGGIHALEHAAIAIFPLLALCDRNDVGGLAHTFHPQVGGATVFIYDGHPGGVGLAKTGFERIEDLLDRARVMVAGCQCDEGCPSCIHSPKCGAGNKPLDKPACLVVLEALLGIREWAGPGPERPLGLPSSAEEEEEGPSFVDLSLGFPSQEEAASQAGDDSEDEADTSFVDLCSAPTGPPNAPKEAPKKRGPGHKPKEGSIGVLDLETQRLSQEVGGWDKAAEMGVSVAVLYDGSVDDYLVFTEDQVDELIDRLKGLALIVGFNIERFDYQVLSAYTDFDLRCLPTLDLLAEIYRAHGFRVSLDTLGKETLGREKSADGLQAVAWFRAGEMDKLTSYCKDDVELTKIILDYGVDNGYVIGARQGFPVKLAVDWARQVKGLKAGERVY